MSNPYVRVLDHVETVHGQRVPVGIDYDAVTIAGLQFGPEVRDAFARVYFQADTEAKAWAEANPPEPVCLRPCCDHCNNGAGDPAGHDYVPGSSAHDGPCEQCASERARREHDDGTG